MSMGPQQTILTALEIGTSKVTAMIARINEDDQVQIIGVGTQPSYGMKKGVIVNIEATVASIQKAVADAQNMAGVPIKAVTVSISGAHVHGFNSTGVVAITNHEVTENDIDRVIEAAKAVAIPADQRILHILPQEFLIDNQGGIREPLGMSGVRLEAKVHMITGSVTAIQNNIKCAAQCGLEVSDVVLSQLAASDAVLTEDERELGVCLIDIGGGTTDIAVFTDGAITHTAVLPIGGAQVSNDLAHALRSPLQFAENIKLRHGTALSAEIHPQDSIEIPGMLDRPGKILALQTVAQVIESRYEELLSLVKQDLNNAGLTSHLAAGIVLTGGGSKLPGLIELAESIFRMPVRLGSPQGFLGLKEVISDPIYSTCAGLLSYTHQQMSHGELAESCVMADSDEQSSRSARSPRSSGSSGSSQALSNQLSKVKSWFSKYF